VFPSQAALFAGEKAGSTEDLAVQIRLIAPPVYVMMTSSMDKKQGIEALQRALTAIGEEITARKGRMQVKTEPHAVSEREEASLEEEMRALELANQEVDGDDDEEDED
jgi:translation initiation factor 2 subunit 1